jgi:Spy/CpxP family protein refolding chaperone
VIRSEDYWEQYVRQFISNYKLEESQAEAARSILRECRQRAAEYRRGRKEEFEKADQKVKAALAVRPRDAAAIRAAYGQMRTLNQPINELFVELKRRLEEIPTAGQKQAYGQAREERLAAMRAQWQERRERMRGGTTTQPTTTRAAEPPAGPSSSQAAGR